MKMSEEIDISADDKVYKIAKTYLRTEETAKTYLGIEAEITEWTIIDLGTFCFQEKLTLKEDCYYGKKGDVIVVDYIFSKGLIDVHNESHDQIDTIKIIGEKKSEQ